MGGVNVFDGMRRGAVRVRELVSFFFLYAILGGGLGFYGLVFGLVGWVRLQLAFYLYHFWAGVLDRFGTRPPEAIWRGWEEGKTARASPWSCRGSDSWGVIPWVAWIPKCALLCFIFHSAGFVACFPR